MPAWTSTARLRWPRARWGLLARRLGLPAITGQILAGVLLGPSAFGVFEATLVRDELEPIVLFAMGLFTVAIGGHLSYRCLHNAKRDEVLFRPIRLPGPAGERFWHPVTGRTHQEKPPVTPAAPPP